MNKILKEKIVRLVEAAVGDIAEAHAVVLEHKPPVILEIPSNEKFGDLSTNIAMQLGKVFKSAPQKIGALLKESIQRNPVSKDIITDIKVEGPGFLNFYLSEKIYHSILTDILAKGADYGKSDIGNKKKVLIEFVSANPTGPLTVAHGRQAAVGDVLANIMKFAGYDVTKEYFINDRGRQINILGLSTLLRYKEILGEKIEFPEDGYKGGYVNDVARKIIEKDGKKFLNITADEAVPYFKEFAANDILSGIKKDLNDFNVFFDIWFSEKKFAEKDSIKIVLKKLEDKGFIYKHEGAVWFKSTAFGDDKDRVLFKSNGDMTYITPDIAYHDDKYRRGYEILVNLWGPDHHGYIPRIKAAVKALGYDDKTLNIVIVQLATLFEGDKQLSMSTRAGEFVTLREVIDAVGRDAGRYFLVRRKTDSHLDFDLQLAKKQSPENPVYYVQYAHARISSIFKKANGEAGLADYSKLKEKDELGLIKLLAKFDEIVEIAAVNLEPHWVPIYLEEVAAKLHGFYTNCRVLSDDKELTLARLSLIRAAKTVIANGLKLLGVASPEEM